MDRILAHDSMEAAQRRFRAAETLASSKPERTADKPYSPFAAAADDADDAAIVNAFDLDGGGSADGDGDQFGSAADGIASGTIRKEHSPELAAVRRRKHAQLAACCPAPGRAGHGADCGDRCVSGQADQARAPAQRRVRRGAARAAASRGRRQPRCGCRSFLTPQRSTAAATQARYRQRPQRLTSSARAPSARGTAGKFNADVVMFHAAFDKAYVSRLTTRLEQRHVRRLDGAAPCLRCACVDARLAYTQLQGSDQAPYAPTVGR